jgi:hypothetical protein
MHLGDHHHHGAGGGHAHTHSYAAPGHNGPRPTTQWQTPHRPQEAGEAAPPRLKDLDLVEASFVEGFYHASDVTSFLRLAGIPFVGAAADGRRLHLLRVEIDDVADVGSVTPIVGGGAFRYDPLPARFASRRRKLSFAYHDGTDVTQLDFAAARALADFSDASHFNSPQD